MVLVVVVALVIVVAVVVSVIVEWYGSNSCTRSSKKPYENFFCLCRVTLNIDTVAGGNNSVDYPGSSQPTYRPPPTKKPYRRPHDTSNARHMKTKPRGSISSAIDQNANSMATSVSSVSRSNAVADPVSGGHEKSNHPLGSEENVQQSGLDDQHDTSDSSMRVLWSGQVAVNGTEICSAELVSRCHVRHTL